MLTKKVFVLSGALIVFFFVVCLFFLKANHDLKERIKHVEIANEETLKQNIEEEKGEVIKSLEKKYRADRESFRAMYERIKLQKTHIKSLESE